MDKQQVLILIGNEICEGCGQERDCGLEYEDCDRFYQAGVYLTEYAKAVIDNAADAIVEHLHREPHKPNTTPITVQKTKQYKCNHCLNTVRTERNVSGERCFKCCHGFYYHGPNTDSITIPQNRK